MKILQVNKFFRQQGGTETYLFGLIDLLKNKGHRVLVFSQSNKDNLPSDCEKYFIENIDLSRFSYQSALRIGRMFWSFRAAKLTKKMIRENRPDIVHIHNIYHQISPSILPVLERLASLL